MERSTSLSVIEICIFNISEGEWVNGLLDTSFPELREQVYA